MRLSELKVPTTALLVPNLVIVHDTILPTKVYSAQPSEAGKQKAREAVDREGKGGMITTGSTLEKAAAVPAAYDWLFDGVPLPDVAKEETREQLLAMIKRKVAEVLPTLAARP